MNRISVSSEFFPLGQEEMAKRSAETRLAEEELRCLDWALQALKDQDSPPGPPLPPQSPGAGPLLHAEPQVGERCVPTVTLRDLCDLHTFTESKRVQLWSDAGGLRGGWEVGLVPRQPPFRSPPHGKSNIHQSSLPQTTGRYPSSTRSPCSTEAP